MLRFLIAGVMLIGLAACHHDDVSVPSTAVRDSAGMRIVENRGDPASAALAWLRDSIPAVDIGGDGDGNLFQVTSATRLSDGKIVVVSSGSNSLEFFGPDGTHLQTVGRAGDGPGEFRALLWVGSIPGDSIFAWDSGSARLSVFDSGGSLVRTVVPRVATGLFPQATGVLEDGRVILSVRPDAVATPRTGTSVQRDSVRLVALDRVGNVQPIVRAPGSEMLVSTSHGFMMRPRPFGRRTVAATHSNRVFVGTGDRFEVVAYEPGHGARSILRAEHHPVRITPADIRDYERSPATLGGEGDARLQSLDRQMLADAPYPHDMPPYTDLKVDVDGNVWLQGASAPSARDTRWAVFGPDGVARGVVNLPADLAVQEIGRDWVLGIATDADHLQRVRLYKLERGG